MTFDEIEEKRDLTAGLEQEQTLEDVVSDWRHDALEAYALDDPKHPDWHSIHADIWDNREGK